MKGLQTSRDASSRPKKQQLALNNILRPAVLHRRNVTPSKIHAHFPNLPGFSRKRES